MKSSAARLQACLRRQVTCKKYLSLLHLSWKEKESARLLAEKRSQEQTKNQSELKVIGGQRKTAIEMQQSVRQESAESQRVRASAQILNEAAVEESMRLMMQSGSTSTRQGSAVPIGRYGTLGSSGWVSTKNGVWQECELLEQTDAHLTLRLSSGVQTVERRACKFYLRNPDSVEAIDDFLRLPYLDEPNILNSLVRDYLYI